jgi:DNA-binding NtrC family response regulator
MRAPAREDPTEAVARGAPSALPAQVRVVGAPAVPDRFELGNAKHVLGAGKEVDVVVADTAVSRRHVALTAVPDGVLVEDLGSRNGTFYAGQRVGSITVSLGSTITIGGARILLEAPALEGLRPSDRTELHGLLGAAPASRRIIAVVERIAGSLASVLIEGESGVGKEIVARAIHASSRVAHGALHVINCGAIPRELVASELFGHRRGAFTGAVEDRAGAFEAADGGSLLLDEIGEMPLELQPLLLRVLESGEVTRVGETQARRVHVRILAATNRSLDEDQRAGRFRADLFYRLAVIRVHVPPLRERPEDVDLLARHFASSVGIEDLAPDLVARLRSFAWPGNARELRNAVHAYAALGTLPAWLTRDGDAIDAALRHLVQPSRTYHDLKDELTERFTRVYLTELLEQTGGNQSKAAELAGLERSYFRRLLAKHGGSR